jgi:hypothetical protein
MEGFRGVGAVAYGGIDVFLFLACVPMWLVRMGRDMWRS